jgi:hypothetical protein
MCSTPLRQVREEHMNHAHSPSTHAASAANHHAHAHAHPASGSMAPGDSLAAAPRPEGSSRPSSCGAGAPFFARGWASLRTRKLNMFTLIALGTGVRAFAYSVFADAVAPRSFPPARPRRRCAVYFEAAAVIVTLVLLGQVLELRARSADLAARSARSSASPRSSRDGSAPGRRRGRADRARDASATAPRPPGRARPGRRPRRRGQEHRRRVDGHRRADPRREGTPAIGDRRYDQRNGRLRHGGGARRRDTLLARIVQLVADAQRSRAPIQRLADRCPAGSCPRSSLVAR